MLKILGLLLFVATGIALGIVIFVSDVLPGPYQGAVVLVPIGAVLMAVFYNAILKRWQRGIYVLIAYMPFSGLPGILLYPLIGSGWPTLIKDFLFVIPAYLSFALQYKNNQKQVLLFIPGEKVTVTLMALFAGLVVLQCFNPQLVNLQVALIGLKVWLFYMPLFVLGYHLIDSRDQLVKIVKVTLALGMIVVAFGIVQAALIYRGYNHIAFTLHGSAAEGATQMFARFEEAGGSGLIRVPGLFTFPLQYSSLLLVMLALAYSLWSGGDPKSNHSTWYIIAMAAIVVALMTSGIRAVYVLLLGYFVLVMVVGGRWGYLWKPVLALTTFVPLGVLILVFFLGSTHRTFLNFATNIVGGYLGTRSEMSLIHQFGYARNLTALGMGTGMNTGQARYGFESTMADRSSYVNEVFGAGVESFPGKVIIELGLPGLILAVFLFGSLLISVYRRVRHVQDHTLRAIGIGLLSLNSVVVAYLYKGAVLDYDPLSVYFWLFAGILMKLPELQTVSYASYRGIGTGSKAQA